MRITVTIIKEDMKESESPYKATFTEMQLAQLFVNALLEDAYESGKITFVTNVDFPKAAGE